MFDTIVAISTGHTNQAISIVRISGPESFSIIKKISNLKKIKHSYLQLSKIFYKGELIDKVLIGVFVAPNSYTGEDVIEINAHGGVIVTQRILELCLIYGARIASPGEFSQRAFLNNKMNLIEAEGINSLIHAQSLSQAKIASKNLNGKNTKIIIDLKNDVLKIIGIIETNIDYPEYDDIEILTTKTLLPKLKIIEEKMQWILKSSILTQNLYRGIKVAIVGKPNVGKSTLLNNLIGQSKAIVSDEPGTTRDIVEGNIEISGVLFHFLDTAGIHKTNNKIENIGIKKANESIISADIVIYLVDPTTEEYSMPEFLIGRKFIKIYSKSDLKKMNGLSISHNNIQPLINELLKRIKKTSIEDLQILMSTRQSSLLKQSSNNITSAIQSLENNLTPDVVIVDIQSAWENIANILGEVHHDDLLTEIFSSFCLGK